MNRAPIKPRPRAITAPVPPPIALAFPEPVFDLSEPWPQSIIHPAMKGLIFLTGPRGKGKTICGLGTDNPKRMIMFDLESKGEVLSKPYGLEAYFPILKETISTYGEEYDVEMIFRRAVQIIKALPLAEPGEGKFTTLFIDNGAELQKGAAQLLTNNPDLAKKFGILRENLETGGYGGAWPGVKHLLNIFFKLCESRGIKLIVVSFQLTGAWKDKKPLFDKWKTTDVSVWHEQSILTLVLVDPMPGHAPTPRALVMKEQLGEMQWDPELNRPTIRRRIPFALPQAEMWRVYNYLNNPCDLNNLRPGESVSALEIAPFLPTFSMEQLVMMERAARAARALEAAEGTNGTDSD